MTRATARKFHRNGGTSVYGGKPTRKMDMTSIDAGRTASAGDNTPDVLVLVTRVLGTNRHNNVVEITVWEGPFGALYCQEGEATYRASFSMTGRSLHVWLGDGQGDPTCYPHEEMHQLHELMHVEFGSATGDAALALRDALAEHYELEPVR